jgi:hypothetical protein
MSGTSMHLDIAQGTSVYGTVYGLFAPGGYPSWLKPLMKATKITSGPNKNYFTKEDKLTAVNGKSFKTGGY